MIWIVSMKISKLVIASITSMQFIPFCYRDFLIRKIVNFCKKIQNFSIRWNMKHNSHLCCNQHVKTIQSGIFITYAKDKRLILNLPTKGRVYRFWKWLTGQSLSSFVTVTNKLGDGTIVVFGGSAWVSMDKRNYDSFWLYWLTVSMYKRNHIENDVVMVATESQTNFTWSVAISIELITNLRSY